VKITIVQGAFLPLPPLLGGAVEKRWFAVGQALAKRGHTVTQISRLYPGLSATEMIEGVRHIRVSGFDMPSSLLRLKYLDWRYSAAVRRVLPRADILISNTFWLPVLLRHERRGKIYVDVGRVPKRQLRLYTHVTRLRAGTAAVAEEIARQEPRLRDKIVVIPNPISFPPRETVPMEKRGREILYAGRIHPEKGISLFLEAVQRLRAIEPEARDWKITIVGPWLHSQGGGGSDYKEMLQKRFSDLRGAVDWAGPIFDEERLQSYYRRAAIFVYPSIAVRGETFGSAPLEAMANGCAVVVSGLACFSDFVFNNVNGLVFDHEGPHAAAALAGRLRELVANPDLRRRLSERALEVRESFSLNRVCQQYEADFIAASSPTKESRSSRLSMTVDPSDKVTRPRSDAPVAPLKITIVQGAFFPVPPLMGGAIEKAWFALGKELVRLGHSVTHISRTHPRLPEEEMIEGVRHLRCPGFDSPGSLTLLKVLDLVYSMRVFGRLPAADILITNTFWLPVLRRFGREESGEVYVHVGRYPKGQMKLYSKAARLQTVSSSIQEAIIEQAPVLREKTVVIPYPLSPEMLVSEESIKGPREKILLYVGRVHPEKGLDLLVRGFARASRTLDPAWKLVVVGPWQSHFGGGGMRFFEKLQTAASSSRNRVEWTGPVFESAQLSSYYSRAALFVYPSLAERGETFGVAPLEAMASGTAPLVSNLGCFHDFILEGETGFFFDHRHAAPEVELAKRLEELLGDTDRIRLAGRRAWRAAQAFKPEHVAKKFAEDFEKIRVQRERFVTEKT
jgi:glycosyltransferase involved in cell wall biosynthesis